MDTILLFFLTQLVCGCLIAYQYNILSWPVKIAIVMAVVLSCLISEKSKISVGVFKANIILLLLLVQIVCGYLVGYQWSLLSWPIKINIAVVFFLGFVIIIKHNAAIRIFKANTILLFLLSQLVCGYLIGYQGSLLSWITKSVIAVVFVLSYLSITMLNIKSGVDWWRSHKECKKFIKEIAHTRKKLEEIQDE